MNTPKRRFWVGLAIPVAGIAAGLAWAGAWTSEAGGRGFLGLAAGILALAGLIAAALLHRAWKRAMDLTGRRHDNLLAPAVVALGEAYPETAVWIGLKENDPGRTLRPVARRCPPDAGLSERALTWAADGDGGAAGEAARTGRMILYPDLWSESRREPLGEGYRTVLALPLAAGGAVLGVLALLAPGPEAFSGGEARILETLALSLGTVLAASRLDPGHGGGRAALKAREAPFQVAFNRMPVPMALTRSDGRLVSVNPALSRLLGYPQEDLEAMNLAEALYPDEQAPVRDALVRLSGGAQSAVHLALRCQRREGSVFWGTLDLIRMDEGQDGPGPMLACLQNITGRRHAEGGLTLFRSTSAPDEPSPAPAP